MARTFNAIINARVLFGMEAADTLKGGDGNDKLSGQRGHDVLNGQDGHDTIAGGNGNDWLVGGNGNDRIAGDAGNDTLIGGSGQDTLFGGAGRDVFRFDATPDALDVVKDFASEDRLHLADIFKDIEVNGKAVSDFLFFVKTQEGISVLLDRSGSGDLTQTEFVVLLENYDDTLTADNFIFGKNLSWPRDNGPLTLRQLDAQGSKSSIAERGSEGSDNADVSGSMSVAGHGGGIGSAASDVANTITVSYTVTDTVTTYVTQTRTVTTSNVTDQDRAIAAQHDALSKAVDDAAAILDDQPEQFSVMSFDSKKADYFNAKEALSNARAALKDFEKVNQEALARINNPEYITRTIEEQIPVTQEVERTITKEIALDQALNSIAKGGAIDYDALNMELRASFDPQTGVFDNGGIFGPTTGLPYEPYATPGSDGGANSRGEISAGSWGDVDAHGNSYGSAAYSGPAGGSFGDAVISEGIPD